MTLRHLFYFARISAQNAAIARMQAENAIWVAQGQSPAYGDGHFLECEQELGNILRDIEEDRHDGVM